MAFLRRKSGVYHEDVYQEDFEPQRRRRLSKPLTNSSYTNLSSLSTQQMTRQKSRTKVAQETLTPVTPASTYEPRETPQMYLFTSTSEVDLGTPKHKRSTVALMTARFEKNSAQASTSQLSLVSSTANQRPISLMQSTRRALESHKSSVSSLASRDRYAVVDLGTVSPTSSTEDLSQDPAPRARRTASFTPGMATRAVSMPDQVIDEENESAVNEAEAVTYQKFVKKLPQFYTEDILDTPSRTERSVTPTNLEYPNIGRMGLGSLRVVNGATSPGPNDLSKHDRSLFVAVRRDTSSVYPESEVGTIKSMKGLKSAWEDEPQPCLSADEAGKAPDSYRSFSFRPGTEVRFNNTQRKFSTPKSSAETSDTIEEEDQTKMMAEDYMAGLPTSPFASVSPPISPIIRDSETQIFAEIATPSSLFDTQLDNHANSPLSNRSGAMTTPVSEGSVRRHSEKAHSRRSFIDETLGSSPILDRADSPASLRAPGRLDSPASFFSVPETDNELEEHYKSAVELQPVRSRSKSPRKQPQNSPLKEALMRNDPQLAASNRKSDSGYSSNTSLSTAPPLVESINYADLTTPTLKEESRGRRFPFRKETNKSGKPFLVKPMASTKLPAPTSVKIEIVSGLTSTPPFSPIPGLTDQDPTGSLSTSSQKTKEKQRKKLQKLRRKSTADAAGELVIQRLASVECFNVPQISSTARANLAQRSENIPELERTYKTQQHTTKDVNASTLSLAPRSQDVRFPSPDPVEELREGRSRSQSRTRRRSLSRPRTWFGWTKEEKEESKKRLTTTEAARMDLSDLGSVAELLGGNPYDMARARPRSVAPPSTWNNRPGLVQRRTSPSSITTNAPRQKSMMDDQAAANLSRARRSASADRSPQPISRPSFDDRGGIPGKFPHQVPLSMLDAPPMPPLPSSEEINRRFSCRNSYAVNLSVLPSDSQQYTEPTLPEAPHEAPPPPPHSPRPSYIDDEHANEPGNPMDNVTLLSRYSPRASADENYDSYEHAVEDEEPPPPPCHSPRPMDVSHEEQSRASIEVNWSSQADAWRARRQSAGEALQENWESSEQYPDPVQQERFRQQDSAYLVQRRKPVPRKVSDQLFNQQLRNGGYNGEGFQSYAWHQTQPDHAQDHVYHSPHDRGYEDDPYMDSQYPRSGSQQHVYANHHAHAMSHDDYHYQHEPQMRLGHAAWQPPAHPSNTSHKSQPAYRYYEDYCGQRALQTQIQPYPYTYDGSQVPLPQHSSHSRPISRHSNISNHSRKSLAEELHPEVFMLPTSPSHISRTQSPHIGRYSGGLEYNYDRYSRGFDGSAGTRSASTAKGNDTNKDGKKRRSWLDMEAYGVDLADVPAMSVPVGAMGSRMSYH